MDFMEVECDSGMWMKLMPSCLKADCDIMSEFQPTKLESYLILTFSFTQHI
jgi:hypothetical protein